MSIEIRSLIREHLTEDGELSAEFWEVVGDKGEEVALMYKNATAEAAALKAEEDALKERRKKLERISERAKQFFADNPFIEVSTPRAVVQRRKNGKVDVYDATRLPNDYSKQRIVIEPDKTKIKNALKAGVAVEGAKLLPTIIIK